MSPRIPPPSIASTRMPFTVVATTSRMRAALLITALLRRRRRRAARPRPQDPPPARASRRSRRTPASARTPRRAALPRPRDAPPLRPLHRPPHQGGHTVLRAGNVIDSVGARPGRAARHAHRPLRFMRGRQRIYMRDGVAASGWPRTRGFSSSSPTRPATGGSSTTRPASSSGAWTAEGKRTRKVADRPEGRLLPARPHPHAADAAALAAEARIYPACSTNSEPST